MMLRGGTGPVQKADDDIQKLVDSIRDELESKSGKKFSEFTAVSYTSQTVAGTNYFVKVKVGQDDFVHVRVFEALPCYGSGIELAAYLLDKKEGDQVEYFDVPNQ